MTLVGPSARCQQRQNLAFTQRSARSLHPSRKKERNIFSRQVACASELFQQHELNCVELRVLLNSSFATPLRLFGYFLRCPVCTHPIILVFDVPGLVNPHLSMIPEV